MREIKFRSWDKDLEFMYPDTFDHPDFTLEDMTHMQDRFVLMQFTGRLDKNDVEIYEGDNLGGIIGGTVRWIEEDCRFGIDFLHDGEFINEWNETRLEEYKQSELEVTGSMYENR